LPAIPFGRAGLVALDCDRRPDGEAGIAAFERLADANGIELSKVPLPLALKRPSRPPQE
jgi:hypothetical protein